jgi:hypothetical protein
MASVNLGEPHHLEVIDALHRRDIAVEAGVFSLTDVETLRRSGLTGQCQRVLVEVFGHHDAQPSEAVEIDAALNDAGIIDVPRLHHGEGTGTWTVLRQAIAQGTAAVRVGLEDTTILPDGTPTHDNGRLVSAAVALVVEHYLNPDRTVSFN